LLFLPLEIFSREYLGKLALAVQVADQDIEVVFGHKINVFEIAIRIKSDKFAGVYFENGPKTKNQIFDIMQLKARNFKVVAQFEEPGIQYTDIDEYASVRPSIRDIDLFDQVFTWGSADSNLLNSDCIDSSSSITKETGTLRAWGWGDRGREFYKGEINALKRKENGYVLFISNLAFSNNVLKEREFLNFSNAMSDEKSSQSDYLERLASIDKNFVMVYEKAIDLILENTSFDVILRTHPVENAEYWRLKYGGSSRVKISSTGPVTPLVLGSKLVIHSGSTVGIESAYVGTPTLSLCYFNSLKQIDWISNLLSLRPKSFDEMNLMLNNIEDIWNINNEIRIGILRNRFRNFETNSDQVLLNIRTQLLILFENEIRLNMKFFLRVTTFLNNTKQNPFIRRGNSTGAILDRSKRPKILLRTVKSDVQKLCKMFGINDLLVSPLGGSTFIISKKK
jgi:surface carbohydrate biosynthesis protein